MPDVRLNLVVDGKPTDAVLRLTEAQLKKMGLTAEMTGQQMGAAFARGAGVAEDSMQDAVKAISQLQAGTLASIKQVDEAIRHLEQARSEASTQAGRDLFGGMIEQAQTVRQGFVQVSDAANGMGAAQYRAQLASRTLGYTLQDSQQFAFGFQQGVNAISNNLPMLIDQISDVARESGGARGAVRALTGAFSGPAGLLTLVSLGVVAFGALSAAQQRSRAETEKQTQALKDQEAQLRDNIRALREMSGAAIAARQSELQFQQTNLREDADRNRERLVQLRQLKETWEAIQRGDVVRGSAEGNAFFDRLERLSRGSSAILDAPGGGLLGTGLGANWGEAIEEALSDARVEATRLSAAFVDTNEELAATNEALRADLDAEIAALKAQEEQIIRNNALSAEQRQQELRDVRALLAVKEAEREQRAGPSDKQLRDQEKADAAAAERRLERMRLAAEQITERETTEAGALQRTVALIEHRFEVERREMREKFGEDEAYAAFLEEQIERLGRLERAAIAAATAPRASEQARPEAALEEAEIDLPEPLDVVETLGVVEMRIKALREQYQQAGTQAERDFIRAQIEGLEKVKDAMEGVREEVLTLRDAFSAIRQGFDVITQAADAAHERRMERIEEARSAEIAAIDEQLAAESGRGRVMTEEEARREALLQKRREVEAKYREEARREKQRQAEAEKKHRLFEIVMNTASAVVEALPNVPLSLVVGGMGAAQLAFAAAQSVPKFARGVDSFRGGMALVGEEGPELVTLGSGSNVLTNRNTEMLLGLMSSASRATPARGGASLSKADLTAAFSDALSRTRLEASGRSLALVQAREDTLTRKAGLR